MTCSSRSGNCSRLSHVAADNRSNLSRGLNNRTQSASPRSDSYNSRKLTQTRPPGQVWEAVQEMFLASRSRFVGLAFAILGNKEDAEDAVQDALLSASVHWRSFEGRSALTTWFTRIVLNAALMIRRKRKARRIDRLPDPCPAEGSPWTEMIPDSQPDPEMVCGEKETFRLIDALLGKMSPILRDAFTVTYYDEKSNLEAGALLGVSTTTFKSRLLRARRNLLSQAQRSLVAPIRTTTRSRFSSANHDFKALSARPADISSLEVAFP